PGGSTAPGAAPRSAVLQPQPYQRELPTWITTGGNRDTAASAGRLGANLLTHLLGQGIDDLADTIEVYRKEHPSGPGGAGRVTLMLHTFLDADGEGAVSRAQATLHRYLG